MCVLSVVIDGESGWHINSLIAPRPSFVHSVCIVWPGQQCMFEPVVSVFSLSRDSGESNRSISGIIEGCSGSGWKGRARRTTWYLLTIMIQDTSTLKFLQQSNVIQSDGTRAICSVSTAWASTSSDRGNAWDQSFLYIKNSFELASENLFSVSDNGWHELTNVCEFVLCVMNQEN